LLLSVVTETALIDFAEAKSSVSADQSFVKNSSHPCGEHHDSGDHDMGDHCHAGHCCFMLFSSPSLSQDLLSNLVFQYNPYIPEGFSNQIYHPPIA